MSVKSCHFTLLTQFTYFDIVQCFVTICIVKSAIYSAPKFRGSRGPDSDGPYSSGPGGPESGELKPIGPGGPVSRGPQFRGPGESESSGR